MAWFKMPEIDMLTLGQVARGASASTIETLGLWAALHQIGANAAIEGQMTTPKGKAVSPDDIADTYGLAEDVTEALLSGFVESGLMTLSAGVYALSEPAEAPTPAALRMREKRAAQKANALSTRAEPVRDACGTSCELSSPLITISSLPGEGEGSLREEEADASWDLAGKSPIERAPALLELAHVNGWTLCRFYEALTGRTPSPGDGTTQKTLIHRPDFDANLARQAMADVFVAGIEREGRQWRPMALAYFQPGIIKACELAAKNGKAKKGVQGYGL